MRFSVKKITLMAVLTASALIIFIIEAQIPLPIPIWGVKLGLANSVTLFALFYRRTDRAERSAQSGSRANRSEDEAALTTVDALLILICRIILGAVFTGRLVTFAFSLSGGLLGFAAQAVMRRLVSDRQIWVCGAVSAVFHNIGQILAAMLITGTPAIAAYLPVLIAAGLITGVITGFVAQITLSRIRRS